MAQSKLADRDRTRSQPLTLAALEEYGALSGFEVPSGGFDPEGAWNQTYRIWMVASGGLAPRPADVHYRGFLEIAREPSADGRAIALEVHQSILQQASAVHETVAKMQCAGDTLCTPRSWTLGHTVRDGRLKPMPEARVEQRGVLADGALRIDDGRGSAPRSIDLPDGPVTGNWSLFGAVGRLPRKESPAVAFTMLQELDEVKPSQRIAYRGADRHTLGGSAVRLHCYQHVGQGILPYLYYVDEQGRLLVAIGGLRAYILDPNVRQLHEQCLAPMAERAKP